MECVIGWIDTKPGQRDAFLAASQDFVRLTRAEPGVLFFELHRSDDDENVVIAIEGYASAEAHEAHVKAAHFPPFIEMFRRHAIGGRFENALGATRRLDELKVGD